MRAGNVKNLWLLKTREKLLKQMQSVSVKKPKLQLKFRKRWKKKLLRRRLRLKQLKLQGLKLLLRPNARELRQRQLSRLHVRQLRKPSVNSGKLKKPSVYDRKLSLRLNLLRQQRLLKKKKSLTGKKLQTYLPIHLLKSHLLP